VPSDGVFVGMPTSAPPVTPERRFVRPSPGVAVEQFILKVHSRCDLSCDHCYVYESVDQSWRARTKIMAAATVEAAARRISEHAATHALDHVDVILHGGEPLLLGPHRIAETVQLLHQVLAPPLQLRVHLQTNAVRLDAVMCEALADHDVKVGVSLDGDRQANDRHRRFANGASSYDQVRRGLALLRRPAYRSIYAGLLCTVDIANDPIRVYEALLREQPPRVDFLLPHATWEHPPARSRIALTPYADWLGRIHDRWTRDGEPMVVRLFDSLLSVAEGQRSKTEAVGPQRSPMAVIETDGTWEQIDSLKVTYDGAAATGLSVHTHSVDDVSASVGLLNSQGDVSDLCQTCRDCAVVQRCGGGLLAHRFHPENGFDNPSVYCADLQEIITHVQPRARPAVPPPGPAPSPGPAHLEAAAVPGWLIDDLAAGWLGTDSLAVITTYQRTVERALFELLAPGLAERDVPGWDLLSRLLIDAPAAAQAALAHPYTRVWARDCYQALHTPAAAPDLGYLAALAASTAIRAHEQAELTVPVAEGVLTLPGLGTVHLDPQARSARLRSASDGTFTVRTGRTSHEVDPSANTPRTLWRALDSVHQQGLSILIDDADPYRDRHGSPVTRTRTSTQAHAWGQALATAWSHIGDRGHDGWGTVIGAATPLRPTPHCSPDPAAADRTLTVAGLLHTPDPVLLARWMRQRAAHLQVNVFLDVAQASATSPKESAPPWVKLPWTSRARTLQTCLRDVAARIAVHERPAPQSNEHDWERTQHQLIAAVGVLEHQIRWSPEGQRFLNGLRQRICACQCPAIEATAI
jgi:uncharacterized protein